MQINEKKEPQPKMVYRISLHHQKAAGFFVASGVRTDVRRHVEIARLQKMSKTMVATKGDMGQYVAESNNSIDGVTKAETMEANWLAYHTLPMSAADEFSRMVPAMFPNSNIAKTYSSGK